MIDWTRVAADIRYDQLSVDPVAMRVYISGITIEPPMPSGAGGLAAAVPCRVNIERLVVSGSALDQRGALGLLDQIERRVALRDVMSLQKAAERAQAPTPRGDLLAMRRLAREYLLGTKRPRSWTMAYYWASMAAASRDQAAAGMRNDLSEQMRLRGEGTEWAEVTSKIEEKLLNDWIVGDVPSMLHTEGAK